MPFYSLFFLLFKAVVTSADCTIKVYHSFFRKNRLFIESFATFSLKACFLSVFLILYIHKFPLKQKHKSEENYQ